MEQQSLPSETNSSPASGDNGGVPNTFLWFAVIAAVIIILWKSGFFDGGGGGGDDDGDDGDGGGGEEDEVDAEETSVDQAVEEHEQAQTNGHEPVDLPNDPNDPLKDDEAIIEGVVGQ